MHPFIDHYQTVITPEEDVRAHRDDRCVERRDGELRRLPGLEVDLSDYAGQQVEISISYVQDFAVSGLGVFLDDVT